MDWDGLSKNLNVKMLKNLELPIMYNMSNVKQVDHGYDSYERNLTSI